MKISRPEKFTMPVITRARAAVPLFVINELSRSAFSEASGSPW